MFDKEPDKIVAYLIKAHGLEVALDVVRKGIDKAHDQNELYRLIPTGINQNPWAHFRRPIDMIFQG